MVKQSTRDSRKRKRSYLVSGDASVGHTQSSKPRMPYKVPRDMGVRPYKCNLGAHWRALVCLTTCAKMQNTSGATITTYHPAT